MSKPKRPKPLTPYIRGGYSGSVVVIRIPKGTPPAEAKKASEWAHNVAKKISRSQP